MTKITTATKTSHPTSSTEREIVLDVVRGVALFGVLTVNALTIFRISIFEQFLPLQLRPRITGSSSFSSAAFDGVDHFLGRAITIGLEMKAFILFSLLFGVGLAAQSERLGARDVVVVGDGDGDGAHAKERGTRMSFSLFAARRLGMLLVMGLIHIVFVWNGDILTLYAVVGMIAAPLIARLSSRALLAIAALLFVIQVSPVPWPSSFASVEALEAHVDAARHIYAFGSFRHVLAFRIVELRPIAALLVWCVPRTLGLFLIGAVVWRTKLFREAHKKTMLAIACFALLMGASAMWITHSDADITHAALCRKLHDVIDNWGSILLSFGYGSTIVILFHHARVRASWVRRILMAFAPLGRMALTSYLTQSIVLGWIFYGYGLGYFGACGETSALAIVLVIFLVQMLFARVWLSHFRYGPIEWVWRSFTYGARQPFVIIVASPSKPPLD